MRRAAYRAPPLLLEFLVVELGVRRLGVLEHMPFELGGGDVLAPQNPAVDEIPCKCKREREKRIVSQPSGRDG
jgi:hypothetical protein